MDAIDERPLALRRKRRASSALGNSEDKEVNRQQPEEETIIQDAPREPPKTPGNRKKRTRFSDSVIEIGAGSMTDLTSAANSSTGLTPALNRTILIPVKSTDKVRKRLSLPEQLMTPASSRSSTGSPLSASPIEIQFAPLSQKISDRTMRRLKRNHLSETTNEIHEENKRSKKALQEEVEKLRDELALARQQQIEATATIDAPDTTHGNTTRVAELENELSNLKQEMREQSNAVDSSIPEAINDRSSVTPPTPVERSALSDPVPIELDDSDGLAPQSDDAVEPTGAVSHADGSGSSSAVSVAEASTQASLPSPDLSGIFKSARLQFEHLFPGENTIGLEIIDPVPFIQTMISRVESLKKEADRLDQQFTIKETSRINMKNNFDRALHQLEHHRGQIQVIKTKVDEEKDRARTAELEISTLEARVENAESKTSELKQQRDNHQRSIERLQPALEYYQDEVTKLTRTILKLESSHDANMARLRSEYEASNSMALRARDTIFNQKVSDLEAEVDAQKIGRLKAEESAVKRLDRIKELENRQAELRSTVSQKQAIIRQLENQIEQKGSGHENEVGQLNVRIGELVSNLASANAELAKARQEASRLSKLVEQEKAAGIKVVESMQSEIKKCAKKVDTMKDEHAEGAKERGEQVAQSFGLITPVVEGGRFRDAEADEKVEGQVELMRGKASKKRPDSGVAMWGSTIEEEDGDGDVVMEDPDEATDMANESHALGFLDGLM
ncbi:MAG: hypothetical protein L6R38_006793 [Xanthoria sp. 2 TBL-2021]|nr:MAG: hypothetical protein L6R38_006793 [Xanthoria sp. 2 TBL-2021]